MDRMNACIISAWGQLAVHQCEEIATIIETKPIVVITAVRLNEYNSN